MLRTWIITAAVAAIAGAAAAQSPATLDAVARKAAVETAARALRERYVYPDVGAKAAATLEAGLNSGAYDPLGDRIAFAQRLTADLQGVTHDKHLRVMAPGGPPPAGMGARPVAEGGVVRADRLAGDIGYLEIAGFPPPQAFGPAVDRAMAALADTKALIIDLRRNGGGDPHSVTHLVSFFIPADKRVHINDLFWRIPGTSTYRTDAFWSEATPIRYLGKPVILLTSGFTFSGGEEFAYDMQNLKLAKIVGETTGGGANPGGGTPLGSDLVMFTPGGRAESPITHTSWEGKGVAPDAPTPRAEALRTALRRLGQSPASGDIDALSQARLFTPDPNAPQGPQPGPRVRAPAPAD